MPSSSLFRRALVPVIAAVLSAGVLAAMLGAGGPAAVEVVLARASVVEPDRAVAADSLTAAAAGVGQPVPLAAPPSSAAPTTTTTTTPTPPAPAPAPAPVPEPAPPRPAAPAPAASPAPAPTPAPAPAPALAPARQPSSSHPRAGACEANMVRWMNEVRAANGLGSLAFDPGIQWVSVAWSDAMASRQHLSHNPDFGGRIFAERPQALSASENVGRTTGSDRSVFDGFMQSPPHRAEILSRVSTHATTACVHDGNQLWVTVNFWG